MPESPRDHGSFRSSGRQLELLDYPDTLLDQEEASEFTRIPRATLSQLRWRRVGPTFVKCGSRVYYRVEDLKRWIRDRRVEPR